MALVSLSGGRGGGDPHRGVPGLGRPVGRGVPVAQRLGAAGGGGGDLRPRRPACWRSPRCAGSLGDKLGPIVRQARASVADLLTDPRRCAVMLSGSIGNSLLQLASLWFVLHAFGATVGIAVMGAVLFGGKALAGAAPTPGGRRGGRGRPDRRAQRRGRRPGRGHAGRAGLPPAHQLGGGGAGLVRPARAALPPGAVASGSRLPQDHGDGDRGVVVPPGPVTVSVYVCAPGPTQTVVEPDGWQAGPDPGDGGGIGARALPASVTSVVVLADPHCVPVRVPRNPPITGGGGSGVAGGGTTGGAVVVVVGVDVVVRSAGAVVVGDVSDGGGTTASVVGAAVASVVGRPVVVARIRRWRPRRDHRPQAAPPARRSARRRPARRAPAPGAAGRVGPLWNVARPSGPSVAHRRPRPATHRRPSRVPVGGRPRSSRRRPSRPCRRRPPRRCRPPRSSRPWAPRRRRAPAAASALTSGGATAIGTTANRASGARRSWRRSSHVAQPRA